MNIIFLDFMEEKKIVSNQPIQAFLSGIDAKVPQELMHPPVFFITASSKMLL